MNRKVDQKLLNCPPKSFLLTNQFWLDWRWNCDPSEVGDVERFFRLAFVSLHFISSAFHCDITALAKSEWLRRDNGWQGNGTICLVPQRASHFNQTKETETIAAQRNFVLGVLSVGTRRVAVQGTSCRTHFWPNRILTTNWESWRVLAATVVTFSSFVSAETYPFPRKLSRQTVRNDHGTSWFYGSYMAALIPTHASDPHTTFQPIISRCPV